MKPKTLALMGVAIACGLGASYMTSRLLAERSSDDDPKVTVLVAKKILNIGDTIKVPEEMFQEKKFTRGDEPPGAIDNIELIKNRVLRRPLRAGDHVTPEDLMGDKDGDGMNIVLPAGFRAVGVRVNVESAASGFASLPLSRVDIVSTVRRADDKSTYAQVLLENVLVLAADDKMRRDDSGKPMPSQVVTLALKPEDALKVRLAGEMGTLSLLLRKINDVSRVDNGKLTFERLKSGSDGHNEDANIEIATAPTAKPPVVEAKPPVVEPLPPPETKPATATKPPVVVAPEQPKTDDKPLAEVKQPLRFKMAITEGGRTRYAEYLLNENGEVIDADGGDAHPPRPAEATEPKTK
jgi:pilus assembly protein CpaB